METNRIEAIGKDGIETLVQISRAAVQSGGELTSEVAATVSKAVRETAVHLEESSIGVLGSIGRVLAAAAQVSERATYLARTTLGGVIEIAGGLSRTAVRVTAEVAIEVVTSVRRTAAAIIVIVEEHEHDGAVHPVNGRSVDAPN